MSAQARWDGFLAQIEQRHAQVRAEAEGAGLAFAGDDTAPLSHQLMAVQSRLQDLERNIIDTWHAKVDDAFSAEGLDRTAGYAKGQALAYALDDLREETEVRIWCELARRRGAEARFAHHIAQEAANAEWRAMRATERAMHAIRPPRPLAPVKQYELAQIAYWRVYLGVRSRYEPVLARDPSLEIRSRMEQWYTSFAEFEAAWVAAGRPREAV